MAGTRSSARLASQPKSSPTQSQESPKVGAGSKRKAEAGNSPSVKRGRKTPEKKEQKTIEETMDVGDAKTEEPAPAANGDASKSEVNSQQKDSADSEAAEPQQSSDEQESDTPAKSTEAQSEDKTSAERPITNGNDTGDKSASRHLAETSKMDDTGKIEPKADPQNEANAATEQNANGSSQNNNAVESHARDDGVPSSILEKGVIYFFFRGRVGIDNPSDVNDIARSYIVLRPIPRGAKIGDGPIGDGNGKCRLLALPKKVLPLGGKDRFMTFVEKAKTTFKELKDDFMSASDYTTKTAGVRHTPAVTPVAEGVYALTTTGRESHLAYMITIPQELGEVQKDMGIREQGSYITSAKNPQYAGPANTNLPESPDFPKEILDEFRSLRWAPLQPKYLDYENTQFLLIGESSGLDGASGDQKDGEADPKEELEKLEGEDEIRIKHMKGDDTIFTDLGISKKEYPQVPSTWND